MPWTEPPEKPVSPRAAINARALRKRPTDPERRLWWHLRYRLPVQGSHFRRQVPIGRSVVDFCCLSARLIVEVDGNQHGFEANVAADARRTKMLEAAGYRVLRFTNTEVVRSIDVVLDTIGAALSSAAVTSASAAPGSRPDPHPYPSPQGGGE